MTAPHDVSHTSFCAAEKEICSFREDFKDLLLLLIASRAVMVRPKNRAEALARLRGTLSRGEPIVGAGAGRSSHTFASFAAG